jgi:hypothetical protein
MRLTYRERFLVIGVVVLMGASSSFVFGIRPVIERVDTLTRVIPERQKQLDRLRVKSAEYLALRSGLDDLEKNITSGEKQFELLTYLETAITQSQLVGNVAAMKQETLQLNSNYYELIVETKLEDVTLKQLVEFLLKARDSNHLLQIKTLYAKKSTTGPGLLNAVIQISTLKPSKVI